jgi:hypothetical protein
MILCNSLNLLQSFSKSQHFVSVLFHSYSFNSVVPKLYPPAFARANRVASYTFSISATGTFNQALLFDIFIV